LSDDDRSAPLVDRVYEHRFSPDESAEKNLVWRELGRYLQRFVPGDGTVIDVACDRGDFITNVKAKEKWATDLRDVSAHLPGDVRFVQADGLKLAEHAPRAYFDLGS